VRLLEVAAVVACASMDEDGRNMSSFLYTIHGDLIFVAGGDVGEFGGERGEN